MVAITLVRHATLLIDFEGARLLVDPMLSDQGQMDPIPNSPNDRRNPLVGLPDVDLDADAVLVTHRHRDHLDDVAREWLPHTLPVLCQPADAADLEEAFSNVRPVDDTREFEELGLTATRVPARHGHGALAEEMEPVSGFVLDDGTTRLYHAGDTVWYDGVAATIDDHDPDAVVVNAGAAQFVDSEPITMTAEGVRAVRDYADVPVLADHMDAINHCLLTRDDLRSALAGDADRVAIPENGETVDFG